MKDKPTFIKRWRKSPYFKYDLLVIWAIILKSFTILETTIILALSAKVTKTTITQAAAAMEVNPMLRLIIDAQSAGMVGSVIIIPAALFGIYHVAKKALFKENPMLLQIFVWIIFYSVLFNFMHDLGTLIGFMIKWGLI